MARYLIGRLLFFPVVLLVLVTLSFFLVRAAPGDPFSNERKLPEEIRASIKAKYGLDKSLGEQYVMYLRNLAQGDLGKSFKYKGRTVNDVVRDHLPTSALVGITAMLLACLLGIGSGVLAATRQNTPVDYVTMSGAMVGLSTPTFVVGPLLMLLVALYWKLLPSSGWDRSTDLGHVLGLLTVIGGVVLVAMSGSRRVLVGGALACLVGVGALFVLEQFDWIGGGLIALGAGREMPTGDLSRWFRGGSLLSLQLHVLAVGAMLGLAQLRLVVGLRARFGLVALALGLLGLAQAAPRLGWLEGMAALDRWLEPALGAATVSLGGAAAALLVGLRAGGRPTLWGPRLAITLSGTLTLGALLVLLEPATGWIGNLQWLGQQLGWGWLATAPAELRPYVGAALAQAELVGLVGLGALGWLAWVIFGLRWAMVGAAIGYALYAFGAGEQLVLPALTLAVPFTARISRLTRAGMLEVIRQEFVKTARAKGLPEGLVVTRHAMRGALLPVISYLGPASANMLVGSLVVEKIFALPGLGHQFVESALNRDYGMVLGLVLVYGSLLVIFNLIVDVAYAFLDPRIEY